MGKESSVAVDFAERVHAKQLGLTPELACPSGPVRLRLTGSGPRSPIQLDANTFDDPDGMRANAVVELCRQVREFINREVMPGNLTGRQLEGFIGLAAISFGAKPTRRNRCATPCQSLTVPVEIYRVENHCIAWSWRRSLPETRPA